MSYEEMKQEKQKLNKIGLIKMALNKDLLSKLQRLCVFANGNQGPVNPSSYDVDKYNHHIDNIIADIFSIIKDYDECKYALRKGVR